MILKERRAFLKIPENVSDPKSSVMCTNNNLIYFDFES